MSFILSLRILFVSLLSIAIVHLTSSICLAETLHKIDKTNSLLVADFIEYNESEEFIYASGKVTITLENYLLTCERLMYDISRDLLWAEGQVKIVDTLGQATYASTVFLKDRLKSGVISDFVIKFRDNTLLASKLAEKIGKEEVILHRSCFTPCNVPSNGKPIWHVSAKQAHIDFEKQKITYRNLFFEIYNVPVLFTPYFSHPTPNADAQTGFLVPDYKNNSLRIPFYLRYKPNIDFTVSPRIARRYQLLEFEARHMVGSGSYILNGSYGKTPYEISKHGKILKDTKLNRYHVFTTGSFMHDEYLYGFNIRRTSDKAYLKNYHDFHDNYLASKLYINKVKYSDYLLIETLYFQDLSNINKKSMNVLILPKIRTKNVINLNDEENVKLIVVSNNSVLQQYNNKQLARSSNNINLTNHIITNNGHVLNCDILSRYDVYFVHNMSNNVFNNKIHDNHYRAVGRVIPEVQLIWRYPLIGYTNAQRFTIEPIVSAVLGREFNAKDKKFLFIDTERYELSEHNIFLNNRYTGIDYHEFGQRLSYGVNAMLLSDQQYYWSIFLGQLLYKHNFPQHESAQNVGRISLNIERVEAFYRFRKNRKFVPIMDEIGTKYSDDKLEFSVSAVQLTDFKRNYSSIKSRGDKNLVESLNNETQATKIKNKIKQVHYGIEYKLNDSWRIGFALQTDLSKRKLAILYKSIKVTYLFDCVSIGAKLYDDYTFDSTRGITKQRTKTISVGLKVLNM